MNGTAHSERNATIQTNLTERTDKKKIRHEVQTDSETDRTERRGCKTDKQKELVRGCLGGTRQGPEI